MPLSDDFSSDYFEFINILKRGDERDSMKAMHKLAQKYHSDYNPGDPEADKRMADIKGAYDNRKMYADEAKARKAAEEESRRAKKEGARKAARAKTAEDIARKASRNQLGKRAMILASAAIVASGIYFLLNWHKGREKAKAEHEAALGGEAANLATAKRTEDAKKSAKQGNADKGGIRPLQAGEIQAPPQAAAPAVTLAAGTRITVRTNAKISTYGRANIKAPMTLGQSIAVGGRVIARRGSPVEGKVVLVNEGNKKQSAFVEVCLTSLTLQDGKAKIPIKTGNARVQAGRDPENGQELRNAKHLVPQGTTISFTLSAPVTIPPTKGR
jgi:hypothetical protein